MAAKKKTQSKATTKKKVAKKKAPSKKAAKKKAPAKKAPKKRAPRKPKQAPKVETFVIYHLRGSSRHWPKKIGDFVFSKEYDKWILFGRPIGTKEWNEISDEITDKSTAEHSSLLPPAVKFVDREVTETVEETPDWKEKLDKANEAKRRKAEESEKKPDELPDTSERSSQETLY